MKKKFVENVICSVKKEFPLIISVLDIIVFSFYFYSLYDFSCVSIFHKLIFYSIFMFLFSDSFMWGEQEYIWIQTIKLFVLILSKAFWGEIFFSLLLILLDLLIVKNKRKIFLLGCISCIVFILILLCVQFHEQINAFFSFIFNSVKDWGNKSYSQKTTYKIDVFCTLYFSIFVGLLAIVFTAISIVSSNKHFSVRYFFKYGYPIRALEYIFPIIHVICTVVIFCLFFTENDEVKLKHVAFFIGSYVFCFISFCYFVDGLFKCDSKKRCIYLLNKYLRQSKKGYKYFSDFYKSFVCEVFKNDRFLILDEFSREIKTKKKLRKNIDFRVNTIKLLAEDFSINDRKVQLTKSQYEHGFEVFTEKMIQALSNEDDLELKEFKQCVSCFIDLYKKYIFDKSAEYISHLLYLRDPLFFYLLKERNNKSEKVARKYVDAYISLLWQSKDLLIYSLRNHDIENFKSTLRDYLSFGQFMDQNACYDDISIAYSDCLVELITWIIHSCKHKKIGSDYLNIIPELIEEYITTLSIRDFDSIIYDTDFNPNHAVVIEETKNYYISVLLLFILIKDGKKFTNLFEKIKYRNSNPQKKEWIGYDLLLNPLQRMSFIELSSIFDDEKVYDDKKTSLINKLGRLIEFEKKRDLEFLYKEITERVLREAIENEILSIRNDFSDLSIEDDRFRGSFKIRSNFILSSKMILGDSSVRFFGTNYFDLFKDNFLFPLFIRYAKITYIASFRDLESQIQGNSVYFPDSLFKEVFNSQDISIWDKTAKIGEKEINFKWYRGQDAGIIEEDDFKNFLCLKTITPLCDKITKEESLDIPDITYSVPIIFEFGINTDYAKMICFAK